MSNASTARPPARRRLLSGVAILALIAGVSIAYARYQARVAPVALGSAPPAVSFRAPQRMVESAAARAPAPAPQPAPRAQPVVYAPAEREQPVAQPGWERVMVSPELRVERVLPPAYEIARERILLEPERTVQRVENGATLVEMIPARYGTRERTVESRPARTVIETIPAVWEWRPRVIVTPSG